ncbi:MAG: hypothetical protein Q8O37_05205 [Sulfuricellaceae bacterium]|nr:hypothetical protein [Sulfuricellaceae bacterium]
MSISKNPDFIPTAALRKKFLAYIFSICGAAKFIPRLVAPLLRLQPFTVVVMPFTGAFGRTLNF